MRGTVERLTTAPRGEVNGAVLDNGTVLHWPPHLEDRYKDRVRVGGRVNATGVMERGPEGDEHLEVQTLTSRVDDEPAAAEKGSARGDRDRRLQELQAQLDRIQRELDELRRER